MAAKISPAGPLLAKFSAKIGPTGPILGGTNFGVTGQNIHHTVLVVGQNIHPNRNSLTVNNNKISQQIATLNVFSIDVILLYFGLTRLFCVLTVFL